MELAALLIQAFPILLLILIFFTAAAIIFRKQQKKFKAFLVSSAACAVLLAADIIAFDCIPYPIDPLIQVEKMPDLVGQSFSECKKNYSDSFKLTVESQEYSSEYPDGAIISHSPSAGKDFLLGEAKVILNTKKIKKKSAPKSNIFEIVGLIFSKF